MNKPVPSLLLCAILLAACATSQRTPEREDGSLLPSVTVVPFSIEPHLVEGEAVRPTPAALLQALASEATASAARALVRSRMSSKVEVAPADAANIPGYRVTGVVRIPLFLPGDEQLHREIGRSEPFVTAAVTLLGPDGKAIRTVKTILAWEDLHGPGGAPVPSDRPVEDVLREAVRQAVEDAIDHLGHPSGKEPRESTRLSINGLRLLGRGERS